MWGLDLKEVSHSIVKRIKFSFSDEDRYFPNDDIQYLPTKGYTYLFGNLLEHKNIDIQLSQEFDKSILSEFNFCFNSMPIDEFYDYRYGHLPYRSIKFIHSTESSDLSNGHVVINYSNDSQYTRKHGGIIYQNTHIRIKVYISRRKRYLAIILKTILKDIIQ